MTTTQAAIDALNRITPDTPVANSLGITTDIVADYNLVYAALTRQSELEAAAVGMERALRSVINDADFDSQAYDDGKYAGCFGYTDNTKALIASGNEALAAFQRIKGRG